MMLIDVVKAFNDEITAISLDDTYQTAMNEMSASVNARFCAALDRLRDVADPAKNIIFHGAVVPLDTDA